MTALTKARRNIENAKRRLEKKPVTENFGANEIRKLRDKYNYCTLDGERVATVNEVLAAVSSFENWCMNYTGR